MLDKKYDFFTEKCNLNIIGIRAAKPLVNRFCDLIAHLYIDNNGYPQSFIASCTTDPGLYWLENPENNLGTAIVKPGQYHAVWQVGYHRALYKALVQVNPITVYRDDKRDGELVVIPGEEETGLFGINYHHAGFDSETVDKWSAGCQVFEKLDDFNTGMSLVAMQAAAGFGDKFTYTLLTENDFSF